jgi:hypothetical protein
MSLPPILFLLAVIDSNITRIERCCPCYRRFTIDILIDDYTEPGVGQAMQGSWVLTRLEVLTRAGQLCSFASSQVL